MINYGYIVTKCSSNGQLNIYDLPSNLHCYANNFNTNKKLFVNINKVNGNENECILVKNNILRTPTFQYLDLFAYRLYEAEMTANINVIAQKTPVIIIANEKQRLMMMNLFNQYNGNQPFIFGDKSQLSPNSIQSIDTKAQFIANDIMDYKKQIWNEALTFLGINNLMIYKKERLVSDEANSNNEVINLNLQKFLAPRKKACEQFNKLFNQNIDVKVRSDLHNIIKNTQNSFNINNKGDVNYE